MNDMNPNNAAQAAHVEALQDLRVGVHMDRHHLPDGDAKLAALDAAISLLRAPVADELPHWDEISAKLERDETLTPLELFIHENEPAGGDADAWRDQLDAALASAPVANSMPIRLSAEVLEYLKEGIENATGCEESDVDYDFANELARLMTGPLYTAPVASAPVAGEAQPTDDEIIDMAVEPLGIDYDRMPYGVVLFARALLSRYAAPQASAEALEVARAALMEIADLADVEADQRGVIVNQALTKIAKMTVAPQASEADDLVGALGQCRDAFPIPDIVGSKLDLLWQEAMSDPTAVPEYVKLRAALSAQPGAQKKEQQ